MGTRGLLPADGGTIQHEEQMYLQQPGYEGSYVMGKIRSRSAHCRVRPSEGRSVCLEGFMDKFNRVGIIPVSLIYRK